MSETLETEKLEPEKLDLASLDIAAEKQAELLRLFPEVRTEGGKVDFDRLRMALGDTVDVGKERYGMNWPGKADCFKAIQRPSLGTLLPVREESVNFDETENLIIEGDNLEVLKLLQKSYQGKVKMIYIDPPYNTGNDFIYPDNYSESLQTYLEYTGQVDNEGRKFSNNTETDGRFHSKWLNMMYPRLYLARNLLREDGVIFVSIDDHEYDNLKKSLNEVFGEENFLGSVTWQKKYAPANDKADFSASHDFIVVYARARRLTVEGQVESVLTREGRSDEMNNAYSNPDEDVRGPWKAGDYTCNKSSQERPNLYYPITQPRSGEPIWPKPTRVWAYSMDAHNENVAANRVWWGIDGSNKVPAYKRFLSEVGGVVAQTVWLWDQVGHTDEAKKQLKGLLPEASQIFDTPKPTKLIAKMLSLATSHHSSDLVMDFFAGSGTVAQAVLDLNREDGGNRRFILVQLPEPTNRKDFKTIADITKERVRRVIQRSMQEAEGTLDLSNRPKEGFRVLKLATSNFNVWNASTESTTPDALEQQLELHIEHIRRGRYWEDLLYEILLKSGFPLTTPVETFGVEGKAVHSAANGAMLICLDRNLTHETITAIAALKPERVVCLDEGFAGNDQLKTNAVLIMKSKGVTKFQTI